jgi:hypothetical protein
VARDYPLRRQPMLLINSSRRVGGSAPVDSGRTTCEDFGRSVFRKVFAASFRECVCTGNRLEGSFRVRVPSLSWEANAPLMIDASSTFFASRARTWNTPPIFRRRVNGANGWRSARGVDDEETAVLGHNRGAFGPKHFDSFEPSDNRVTEPTV